MEDCTHPFGIRIRESGEQYCPLCRKPFIGFWDDLDEYAPKGNPIEARKKAEEALESARQRRSKTIKPNGWRRVGDSSSEGK